MGCELPDGWRCRELVSGKWLGRAWLAGAAAATRDEVLARLLEERDTLLRAGVYVPVLAGRPRHTGARRRGPGTPVAYCCSSHWAFLDDTGWRAPKCLGDVGIIVHSC